MAESPKPPSEHSDTLGHWLMETPEEPPMDSPYEKQDPHHGHPWLAGYHVLLANASTVPNAIAAIMLHISDLTGTIPNVYFSWSETPPLTQVFRFLLFGEGDVPPVTHEVLRANEPTTERRPICHVA